MIVLTKVQNKFPSQQGMPRQTCIFFCARIIDAPQSQNTHWQNCLVYIFIILLEQMSTANKMNQY